MASDGKPHSPPELATRPERSSRPPTDWIASVFTTLETPLIRYVTRFCSGNSETARDVVQEAFVRICQQRWPEIKPHATAWLYRTCRNRAIDISRREGLMNRHTASTDVTKVQDRSSSLPEDALSNDEQLKRLRAQLRGLSDRQQEVLRLRIHDNLSYKQIASITGLTVSNVGFQLHQAITNLRASLLTE